ncbi:MAG: N-formylglutamate amidohydrolase [Cyclobacteriaceae bacterium]
MELTYIITAEHCGNQIPARYQQLFKGAEEVRNSHRGWDPGTKEVATQLAKYLGINPYLHEVSRLLVEINRSIGHPQLFSEFTRNLPIDKLESIKRQFYHPHRSLVEAAIREQLGDAPVIQLSIHSFTPVWEGHERPTDIGLLFDPKRKIEAKICESLAAKLGSHLPDLQVDFNEPYKGVDDGFTTYLRTVFNPGEYAGIEIELNQKISGAHLDHVTNALCKSIPTTLA